MLSVQNNFLQIIVQSHESVSKLAAYKTINEQTGYNNYYARLYYAAN